MLPRGLSVQQRERLRAVICALDGVALALEINFQRGDYVLFVVADKYVVHSLHLAYYINVSRVKNQGDNLLRNV